MVGGKTVRLQNMNMPAPSRMARGGGYSVQKTLRRRATNMGSKISLLVYEWPLKNVEFGIWMGWFFSKFSPIWTKIGSKLRKFWTNQEILLKIWSKIGPIGIWMGHFFWKNWYLYRSTLKFRGGTSLPKPNLSYPTGQFFRYNSWFCDKYL